MLVLAVVHLRDPRGVNVSWFLVLFLVHLLAGPGRSRTSWATRQLEYCPRGRDGARLLRLDAASRFGHALAARREGIEVGHRPVPVRRRDEDEPRHGDARRGFRVAVAGRCDAADRICARLPVTCWPARLFWDAARAVGHRSDASPPSRPLASLVSMNLLLLVFNLVPAFPLDGGRIAAPSPGSPPATATNDSLRRAVRVASAFCCRGAARPARRGDVVAACGSIALGWLLGSSARAAAAQTPFTEQLAGITVADVMDAEPVTIPAVLPVAGAYDDSSCATRAAVVRGRRGRRPLRRARPPPRGRARRARGGRRDAGARRRRAGGRGQVPTDAPLEALLASEPLRRLGALMAVDADGRLRGVVTLSRSRRALQART